MVTAKLSQVDSPRGGVINRQARDGGLALCVAVMGLFAGSRQSARPLGPPSRCQVEESSRKGETGFRIGWLLRRKGQRQRVCAVEDGFLFLSLLSQPTIVSNRAHTASLCGGGGGRGILNTDSIHQHLPNRALCIVFFFFSFLISIRLKP